MHKLHGKTPATNMTGTPQTSLFWAEFGWFDFIWYYPMPGAPKKLGCSLGPALNVGSVMCGIVITEKAAYLDPTSIMQLTTEDLNDPVVQVAIVRFMEELSTKLDGRMARLKGDEDPDDLHDEFAAAPHYENYEPWTPQELGFDPDLVEHKPQ